MYVYGEVRNALCLHTVQECVTIWNKRYGYRYIYKLCILLLYVYAFTENCDILQLRPMGPDINACT